MKPILCFYMGYTPAFNGANYGQQNIFGSEITSIKLAESLTDIYDVYIFVNGLNSEDEILYKGVQYLHTHKLHHMKNIDIMIVVRYINYFIYFKNIARKTFIWLHDVTVQPAYDGKILHSNGDCILYNLQNSYDKLIMLSDYHFKNNYEYIGIPKNKYSIIPNIIDTSYYKLNIQVIKNRFIYMSDISRGFTILLDCLLYIQNYIPDISLTVFRSHEFTDEIRHKLSKLNNTIIYGKESQEKIAEECLKAEYFFYPTNFDETFCNCAAEAQLYHCVCIYNNRGSLNTTIGNRGMAIDYDINSEDYIEKTCTDVISLMNSKHRKMEFLNRGFLWAKQLHIDNIKKKWIELFE